MKKSWLNYLNLSDHYERKARFIPGILALLPLLPVGIAFGLPILAWFKLLLAGAGIGAIIAVAISHLASAFGNRLQDKLWPDWPHDSPTNCWLHPGEKSVSEQQKLIWYQAIKNLTQIDIEKAIDSGDPENVNATINDTIKVLRSRLWKDPKGERVQLHNIDYGFSRNLSGLKPIWMTFSLISLVGCWLEYLFGSGEIIWAIASSVIFAGAIVFAIVFNDYVRKKAHYYSESFFGAVVAIDNLIKEHSSRTDV